MVRAPAFNKNGIKKGAWSEEEDEKLRAYVLRYGHWNWHLVPKFAGLSRCGKSCRLRWVNYLRPDVKRGNFTKEEDELIVKLHEQLGNRWSMIASNIPGRTDNEIKNRWHTRLKKQYAKQLKNQSGRLSLAGVVEGVCLPLEKLRFKLQFLLATGPTGSLSNDRHQSAAKSKEQSGETKQSEIFVNVERVVGGVLPNSSNTPSDVFLESSSQPPETFSSGFYNLNSDSAQVALSDAIWVPEDTLGCSGDFWTEPFITDASTTCETLPMSFEQCGCTSSVYYYDDFLY